MTEMATTVCLAVALIFFVVAAFPPSSPFDRLFSNLGLAFLTASFLVTHL